MKYLSLLLLSILIVVQYASCKKNSEPIPQPPPENIPDSSIVSDTSSHPDSHSNDKENYSFLALGDSYTIGQSVPVAKNFPHQTVELLKAKNITIDKLKTIAVTGWTTINLANALKAQNPSTDYDLVTLLIGVNDQYQGGSAAAYAPRFESLLQQAIKFADGRPAHVVVLSIPDWGVTPFAEGLDRDAIAKEINNFNAVNKKMATQYHTLYLNITPLTKLMRNDPSLVAADGLHPSAKEYHLWALKLADIMKQILDK